VRQRVPSNSSESSLIVALAGYQNVSTLSNDYQHVPVNWWNSIVPLPKPGSLCTPQNLSAGDSFTTTSGIFQWTVTYPDNTDPSIPFIPYRGVNLEACDVSYLGINANALSSNFGLSASVLCNSTDLPILMRAYWSPWGGSSNYYDEWLQLVALNRISNVYKGVTGIHAM
jgi:hypothetical protein